MRHWLEVAIDVPPEAVDALSERLRELGAPGVIEEPAGERVRVRAHFPETTDAASMRREVTAMLGDLEEFFPGSAAAAVDTSVVADEDWAEGWKQSFPPIDVGARLRIRPPWLPPLAGERLDVEIEPAMAFGTGQHASTLGCLLALEEICESGAGPKAVLDVGTGSAILAIAAARLGAQAVLGVDVDPVAVEAARKNVARNRVESVVALDVGSLERVHGRFALILANLYSGLLRGMFGGFAERAAPGALLVVSGFLDADRDLVSASARAAGWTERSSRSIEGWTTLTLRHGS